MKNCSDDRLRQLAEADSDGRVAILPYKIGEQVRGVNGNWNGEVAEISINSVHCFFWWKFAVYAGRSKTDVQKELNR